MLGASIVPVPVAVLYAHKAAVTHAMAQPDISGHVFHALIRYEKEPSISVAPLGYANKRRFSVSGMPGKIG